jgi:hypothetical protein
MKITVRIKGGIGNQLFCYATARRLSIINKCELIIDDISGFAYDYEYGRKSALHNFALPCRNATPAERFEPFSRIKRFLIKLHSSILPYERRKYIQQKDAKLDAMLIKLKLKNDVYLDGLWQSHKYFEDIEEVIRNDLRIIPPTDDVNVEIMRDIKTSNSVAIHIRFFDNPVMASKNNLPMSYYHRAINYINSHVENPRFFLFSDNPEYALEKLNFDFNIDINNITIVSNNSGDKNSYADLWLMSHCEHFIIANSTFSWWGAWLANGFDKIVIYPKSAINDYGYIPWVMTGEMPEKWIPI